MYIAVYNIYANVETAINIFFYSFCLLIVLYY